MLDVIKFHYANYETCSTARNLTSKTLILWFNITVTLAAFQCNWPMLEHKTSKFIASEVALRYSQWAHTVQVLKLLPTNYAKL